MYKSVLALFVAAAVATAGEKGQAPAKAQAPAKGQDAAPAKAQAPAKGQAAKGEVVVVKEKRGLFAGLRSRRAAANCNCE